MLYVLPRESIGYLCVYWANSLRTAGSAFVPILWSRSLPTFWGRGVRSEEVRIFLLQILQLAHQVVISKSLIVGALST